MKLNELQNKLNDIIEVFIGEKVEMGDFHDELRGLINDTLNEFGNCEYHAWSVDFGVGSSIGYEHSKLLDLKIDLKEDKRHTWKCVGVVKGLEFTLVDSKCSELTADEIMELKRREHTLDHIEYNKSRIEQLKAEIRKLKEKNEELELSL